MLKTAFVRSEQKVAVVPVNLERRFFPKIGVPHLPINRGVTDELIPRWLAVLQSVCGEEHHAITGLDDPPHVSSTNAPRNAATEPLA
jgi:hypothetical protein